MSDRIRHLRFRSEERREIALAASIKLSEVDAGQYRVTPGVLSKHSRIDGTLMDISSGGAGLVVGEYIPKWSRVVLGVHRNEDEADSLVSAAGIVRRVQMLDRRPSYLVGIGFNDLNEDELNQIAELISEIDGLEVERE